MNAQETVKYICEALLERKGKEIDVLHVEHLTSLTEYFVICSATSTTQVKALCENLEEKFSKEGVEPRRTEGVRDGRWGVVDYGDVIVHIFNDESRLFYHLERLWEEGDNVKRYE